MRQSGPAKGGVLSAVVVLIALLVIGYGLFWVMTAEPQPAKQVTGTVESFGMAASYNGNSPLARVRLVDGSTRDVPIDSNIQQGCEIGAKIGLVQTGMNIEVAPGGCHASSVTGTDN